MIRCSGLTRNNAGATAIEFAFVAGILALLTLGVIDYGRAFWYRMQVQNAAQAGADWAQYNSFGCGGPGSTCVPSGLQNSVVYATNLLLNASFGAAVSNGNISTVTASNGDSFTVTASNGNSTCGCPNGSGGMTTDMACGSGCGSVGGTATGFATVSVSYTFTPFFPNWPGLGASTTLTGSATSICEGGQTC